jgi:hypothetical protein
MSYPVEGRVCTSGPVGRPDHGEPLAAQRVSGLAVRRIGQRLVPRSARGWRRPSAAKTRYLLDNRAT